MRRWNFQNLYTPNERVPRLARRPVRRKLHGGFEPGPAEPSPRSREQRRPGRIRRIAGRWDSLLVAAGEIDREQLGSAVAARIAEEHEDAAVRRPGRSLVVKTLGKQPF